ncbi:MAG: hypothetical protein JSS65_01750 [Armatimonadetes bacterium]|nr:hypothetical protein [Armatimonadota bacterium]
MKAKTAPILIMLASLALAVAPTGLERTTKVGDKSTYALVFDYKMPQGSGMFTSAVEEETKAVTATGFEVQRTYKDTKVSVDGQDFPQNFPPYTLGYDKAGKVLTAAGDEVGADATRFIRMWTFVAPGKPVDVNDTWKVEEAEDKDAGKPAFEANFKMVGKDAVAGFDTAKVEFSAKETGDSKATAKGTFWIRLTDGATVKAEIDLVQAPNPGQPMDGKLTYSLKP